MKKTRQQLVEEAFVRARIWEFPICQVDVIEGALNSCRGEEKPAICSA